MKKLLSLSFFVFYVSLSYCQDSYITLNGHIISGTIENKEWTKNPTSVIFNEDDNGNKITLTPENCKGFAAGSDTYTSYYGKRIANSTDVILDSRDESDSLMRDTVNVFLRQIFKDKKYILYELNDAKRINFYLSIDGKIRELEYYETLAQNEIGTSEGVPHNIYKSYLYQVFSKNDISRFQVKIKNLAYRENDLIDFFVYILNDKSYSKEKLRDKYPSEILVGLGANANSGNIITHISYLPTLHQTTFSPSFEVGLRVYSQRNFGKFFFQPSISAMEVSNKFTPNNPPGLIMKTSFFLTNINLGAGYILIKKPWFSLYADAAFALPILINYETQEGIDTLYTVKNSPEIRAAFHSELGVIISRTLNISVSSLLPFTLPYASNRQFDYKISQASVTVKYSFIHNHNTKKKNQAIN